MKQVKILDSIIYGRGLFANEPIKEGEEIISVFKTENGKLLFNEIAGHISNSVTPTAIPLVKGEEVMLKSIAGIEKNRPITINYKQWNDQVPAQFKIHPLIVTEIEKTQGGRINTIFLWSSMLLYMAFLKKKDEPLTPFEKGFFAFSAVTIFISCGMAFYTTRQKLKEAEKT